MNKRLKQDKEYFYTLGYSDSRVTAEKLLGAESEEVFVHRNIANMVIGLDLNTTSVLDYAIEHLKVKHIIVCGHYNCGEIKFTMISKAQETEQIS